jgi:hypothetical protein
MPIDNLLCHKYKYIVYKLNSLSIIINEISLVYFVKYLSNTNYIKFTSVALVYTIIPNVNEIRAVGFGYKPC